MDPLLMFILGLAILVFGADLVIRGGTRTAELLGISPIVIGVTVVAIGTSVPELIVGIEAALQGHASLTVGNIAGTNTLNILLILGFVALLDPVRLGRSTITLDLPMIVIASVLLLVLCLDGELSTWDGILLIALGVLYSALIVRNARRESSVVRSATAATGAPLRFDEANRRRLFIKYGLLLATGIGIIVIGADLIVDGAIELARDLGVSEAFIGLTIVAIGTSAPEFVTAVMSTIRHKREIAVGNLIGSSVYNIAIILGLTCLVTPEHFTITQELLEFDIPVMVGAALLCVPVFLTGRIIQRFEGAGMVGLYVVYFGLVLVTHT